MLQKKKKIPPTPYKISLGRVWFLSSRNRIILLNCFISSSRCSMRSSSWYAPCFLVPLHVTFCSFILITVKFPMQWLLHDLPVHLWREIWAVFLFRYITNRPRWLLLPVHWKPSNSAALLRLFTAALFTHRPHWSKSELPVNSRDQQCCSVSTLLILSTPPVTMNHIFIFNLEIVSTAEGQRLMISIETWVLLNLWKEYWWPWEPVHQTLLFQECPGYEISLRYKLREKRIVNSNFSTQFHL